MSSIDHLAIINNIDIYEEKSPREILLDLLQIIETLTNQIK
jgi:hypothetical protein